MRDHAGPDPGPSIVDLEGALRESEERFRALVDGTRDGVFMVDPEGRFVFVNDFIAQSSGFPKEAFIGRHFSELIRPEDLPRVQRNFELALAGETPEPYELAYRTASDQLMWVEISTARVAPGGETTGVLSISRNIQARKTAETALRESEAKYRTLIETLPHAVLIVQDWRPVFVNDAARRLLGFDPVDRDVGIEELTAAWQRQRITDLHRRRVGGEDDLPRRYQTTAVRPDGTETPVEVFIRPIQYGGRAAWQCLAIDLTERQTLEAQLQHSQKMEAIGTLAGGIAHDFNNLLTGILGMAELLQRRHEDDDDVRGSAEVIERAARRASELTRQLLGFARKNDVVRVPVDVQHVVDDVCEILARTLDKRIRLHRRFGTEPVLTLGDPTQLEQVLMNLAVNARDAMREGGDLTFETDTVTLEDPGTMQSFGITPGTYCRVRVRDTGTGIPATIRSRVFDPFFTTKPVGEGSGMGLSVAYGIVRSHHGAIRVESPTDTGAEIAVFLPLAPAEIAARAAASAPKSSNPPRGQGVVLLVDDEELLRSTATSLLEALGYEVLSCPDGTQAIELLRSRPGEIDVALLDVSMPQMNGWACLDELRRMDADLPVIMTSGRAPDARNEERVGTDAAFLPKPYSLEELAQALACALRKG